MQTFISSKHFFAETCRNYYTNRSPGNSLLSQPLWCRNFLSLNDDLFIFNYKTNVNTS